MRKHKKKFLVILFILLLNLQKCKTKESFDLRENANYENISMDEDCLSAEVYPGQTLNYVRVLLYTWKSAKINQDSSVSDLTLQALSIIGDIQSVNFFSHKEMPPFPQLSDSGYVNRFKKSNIKRFSAKEFILKKFSDQNIIMFNEAHDRPQTRAFVLSMLEDFKKAGFKCLALETLSEKGNLKELNGSTGYYTQEPMSGELVREAIRLGLRLIPYEDRTSFEIPSKNISHTSNQRDSVQARNLYRRIETTNGIEKTIVLAGYGHIAETYDSSYTSMAMNFKKFYGLNPLTIEQTLLIEELKASPYAHRLLEQILNKDSVFAFRPADLRKFGFDSTMYDLHLYHPSTTYIHNRPEWLITSKDKYFVKVEIPGTIKPVLVQAYLSDEIKSNSDYNKKIPCDQTFYSENNCAWFALRKGKKYKVVYRDEKNGIIHVKDISS